MGDAGHVLQRMSGQGTRVLTPKEVGLVLLYPHLQLGIFDSLKEGTAGRLEYINQFYKVSQDRYIIITLNRCIIFNSSSIQQAPLFTNSLFSCEARV